MQAEQAISKKDILSSRLRQWHNTGNSKGKFSLQLWPYSRVAHQPTLPSTLVRIKSHIVVIVVVLSISFPFQNARSKAINSCIILKTPFF